MCYMLVQKMCYGVFGGGLVENGLREISNSYTGVPGVFTCNLIKILDLKNDEIFTRRQINQPLNNKVSRPIGYIKYHRYLSRVSYNKI